MKHKRDYTESKPRKKAKIENYQRDTETKININTNLPDPGQAKIVQKNVKKYTSTFHGKYRMTAEWMVDNLQYISFEMLKNSLEKCVSDLNNVLQEVDVNSLFYCIEKEHSSEWVTDLATSKFNPIASPNKRIEFEARGDDIKFRKLKFNQKKTTMVLIDDWSISGSQLRSILEELNHQSAINDNQVQVIFAVPFITNAAIEYIQDIETHSKFKLTLIYGVVLPTIYEAASSFCEEKNKDLKIFLDRINLCLGDCDEFSPETQVLAFSDWKTLDFVSMPGNFTAGLTPAYLSLTGEPEVNPFVPDIHSLYHREEGLTLDFLHEELDECETDKNRMEIKLNSNINVHGFFTPLKALNPEKIILKKVAVNEDKEHILSMTFPYRKS